MKQILSVPEEYADIRQKLAREQKAIYTRCLLWCAAVVIAEYIYLWQYFAERINAPVSALIAAVLLLIYPVKQGIFRMCLDRGWEGHVRDVKKKSYIHFRNLWGRAYSGMTTRIEGHLYLHGKQGRSPFLEKYMPIRKKYILQSSSAELPYRTGDRVRCYRGCAYPVIVTRSEMESYPPRICVFCGKVEQDREHSHCDFCGFSLITPAETVIAMEYGM